MEYSLSNSLVGGSKSLNPLGLSLDLQFSEDGKLNARKGPTPTFTRASTATYYGPKIQVNGNELDTIGVLNGRAEWFIGNLGSDYISVFYNGTRWEYSDSINGVNTSYVASLGTEFRPDKADWSAVAQYIEVTASGSFNTIIAAPNEPRFDHDTTTDLCKGLLMEESRTNIVFPSNTLTTQTRTVTAALHTLSFYETGTVVLSGAHAATVIGTGAYPTITTLTFTPTAGSLILTVTGSVTQAQLEVGAFPTSYIPTTSGALIRSADVCSISGGDFASIWNGVEATMFFRGSRIANKVGQTNWDISSGTGATSIASDRSTSTERIVANFIGIMVNAGLAALTEYKLATALKTGDYAVSFNGASVTTSANPFVLTLNKMTIGMTRNNGDQLNGWVHSVKFYKKRLSNAIIQNLSV